MKLGNLLSVIGACETIDIRSNSRCFLKHSLSFYRGTCDNLSATWQYTDDDLRKFLDKEVDRVTTIGSVLYIEIVDNEE